MGVGPSSSTSGRRRPSRAQTWGWLSLTLLTGLAAPTQAGESVDRCQRNMVCRVHSNKGILASERKNYAEALQEFQAAYAAEPAPRLLVNIGRSLYRLDRPQQALDYYNRYRRAETSLDAEAEQTLRRYENEALVAMAGGPQYEPPPAPLLPESNPIAPRVAWGLLGTSLGLFVVGIGLGAGAVNAAGELSQKMSDYPIFGPVQRALEVRGQTLQTAGVAFDVVALVTLSVGASVMGMWLYQKKTGGSSAARQRSWASTLRLGAPSAPAVVSEPGLRGF